METPSPSGKHVWWWLKIFRSDVAKVRIEENGGGCIVGIPDRQAQLSTRISQIRSDPCVEIRELLDMGARELSDAE